MGLGLDLHQLVYRGRVNCLYPFKKKFQPANLMCSLEPRSAFSLGENKGSRLMLIKTNLSVRHLSCLRLLGVAARGRSLAPIT